MAAVIPASWMIPDSIRKRVGDTAGTQRALTQEGHLLLILHELPKANETTRPAILFWRTPNGAWQAGNGNGLAGGLPVLTQHLAAFQHTLLGLDEQVDAATSAQDFFAILQLATPLARTARNTHRALQTARESIGSAELITLRDSAGNIERLAELLVLDARNGLEYTTARNAEIQAQNAHKALVAQNRLNVLAAFFFPATAVGSILGTNMVSGLEAWPSWVFWMIVVVAFFVGIRLVRWLS